MEPTLKLLRINKHLTQEDVAKALGIHTTQYGAIESFNNEMLEKLAKLYGVKPEDIKVVS